MRFIFYVFLINIFTLFFSACAGKIEPSAIQNSSAKTIRLITPQVRLYDNGFLKVFENSARLEIYNAGALAFYISADNEKICFKEDCYTNSQIAEHLLKNNNFASLDFSAILRGDPIFGAENLMLLNADSIESDLDTIFLNLDSIKKTGFSQTITRNDGEIFYKVENEEIFFSEKKSRIVLEITNLIQDSIESNLTNSQNFIESKIPNIIEQDSINEMKSDLQIDSIESDSQNSKNFTNHFLF